MPQPTPHVSASPTGDLQVLVFGPQAQSVDAERLVLTGVSFPITPDALLIKIADAYPELASSLGVSRIAVNHSFAAPNASVEYGDEVALVGLISGG